MKYVNSCGTLCVVSDDKGRFFNFMAAVMALNAVQMFYASFGFCVNSTICEETKLVEVRIHFDSFDFPTLPACYHYTRREITSQSYTGYNAQPCERIRVVAYSFEF